jgi:hypothetical protein
LENDEHLLDGDTRYSGYGSGDFGGKARGLGFCVALAGTRLPLHRPERLFPGYESGNIIQFPDASRRLLRTHPR